MKDSDVIAENHNHRPFLVNVHYKKLEILKTPIICDVYEGFVSQWKINVNTQYNCDIK